MFMVCMQLNHLIRLFVRINSACWLRRDLSPARNLLRSYLAGYNAVKDDWYAYDQRSVSYFERFHD